VNDGEIFDRTMAGVLDEYPDLESVAVVPLGLSRFNKESAMRLHTPAEAAAMVDAIEDWQDIFLSTLGHRMVFAADEYYLMAGRPFPPEDTYGDFSMHEDGIGMARTFEMEFNGRAQMSTGPQAGFFAAVDAPPNPAAYTGLRSRTCGTDEAPLRLSARRDAPIGILTGEFGARVIAPLIDQLQRSDVRVIPVANEFFGGNTAVTGLMVGPDLQRVLADEPLGHRYLLPDVCLSEGRFLDGTTIDELPRSVEVIATDGISLRKALEPAS
jgi:NifB/MoaA-like Fe-S oxidoreductase